MRSTLPHHLMIRNVKEGYKGDVLVTGVVSGGGYGCVGCSAVH